MFCIKCGSEDMLCENLCGRCYAEERTLVKIIPRADMILCVRCSSRKVGKRWEGYGELDELLDSIVMDSLQADRNLNIHDVELTNREMDEHRRTVHVKMAGDVIGHDVLREVSMELFLKKGVCLRCSRIAGRYFEAILQLRGEDARLDNRVKDRIRHLVHEEIGRTSGKDRTSFISSEVDIHTGVDFYLGRSSDGRNLARLIGDRYGSKVKESSTLVGRREGKDFYRMTYLVRIPRFSPGDHIRFRETVYRVMRIEPERVGLLNLRDGNTGREERKNLWRADVLGGDELIERALVVSCGQAGDEVTIMNPRTFHSSVILVPDSVSMPVEGQETDVIIDGDDIYLV